MNQEPDLIVDTLNMYKSNRMNGIELAGLLSQGQAMHQN